jgi:ABC-type uncharacterized transport system ATPase subunit
VCLREGEITGVIDAGDATEESLMRLMTAERAA